MHIRHSLHNWSLAVPVLVFVIWCCSVTPAQTTVIGIDLGGEWFKVAMIHGQSFDLVLNPQSKRKTPTVVTFYRDERVFGVDAARLITKVPRQTYQYITDVIGRAHNSSFLEQIRRYLPYTIIADDSRHSVKLPIPNGEEPFFPEEVLGMILKFARDLAEVAAESSVKDCVIVVPSFYTDAERQAVLDAASLAGLNVLSLMNSGAAVALNYGLFRASLKSAESSEVVVFYDIGTTNTQVTLVEYSMGVDGKKNKTVPQATIRAVAWDATLGCRDFDYALAEHFAGEVNSRLAAAGTLEELGGDVRHQPRAMAKLLLESSRVKEVLSANTEAFFGIEGIVGDVDFRSSITRQQFEQIIAPLVQRLKAPLVNVLHHANMTSAADVNVTELFGGCSRVPKVQEMLGAALSELGSSAEAVGKHINADEAAALGGAYYAASLSSSHHVKEFKVRDITPFAVRMRIDGAGLPEEESVATLFRYGSRLGSRRNIAFHTTATEFTVDLSYENSDELPPGTLTELARYQLSGMPTVEQYSTMTGTPKVNLAFRLNNNALLDLEKAEVEFTILTYPEPPATPPATANAETPEGATGEQPVTTQTTADEPTANPENTEAPTLGEHTKEAKTDNSETSAGSNEPEAAATATTATEQPAVVEPVKKTKRQPLKVVRIDGGVLPLSAAQLAEARRRLAAIEAKENLKKETEKAKNDLESFIYSTREALTDESSMKFADIAAVSTPEQRDELLALVNTAADWLDGEGFEASKADYKEQLAKLHTPWRSISLRVAERVARPEAVEQARKGVAVSRTALALNLTEYLEIEPEELNATLEAVDEFSNWLDAALAVQEQRALHEDPHVTSTEITRRWEEVERKVKRLLRSPKRKPPKPPAAPEKVVIDETEKQPTEPAEPSQEGGEQSVQDEPQPGDRDAAPPADTEGDIASEAQAPIDREPQFIECVGDHCDQQNS